MLRKSDEEYVMCFLAIEQGIFAASEKADENNIRLIDKMAFGAVKKILQEVRGGNIGKFRSEGEKLVFENIYDALEAFLDESEYGYTERDLTKILKHLMESAKTRAEMHGPPDGYLLYLEEFMETISESMEEADDEEE